MRPTITLMLPEYRVDQSMGGIGVRALDLATALSTRADVTIVCSQPTDLPNLPCPVLSVYGTNLKNLISKTDAVIFFDLGDVNLLRHAVATDRFIVVENAVPLEHLEYDADQPAVERNTRYRDYVADFRAQLTAADHFLTRSKIERRLLVGALALEGRLSPGDICISPTLEHLVSNVPIGICARDVSMRSRVVSDPNLFLWTGGLWDYMDYETAIDAFSGNDSSTRLCFLYRPPVDQHLRAHKVFASDRTLNDRVFFGGRNLLHTKRDAVIERANGLICIARPGIENESCVRLRIRDTLLYRRPIIVDLHGATGEYVSATGIGIALPDPSPRTLSDAVARLNPDNDKYHACLAAIESERRKTVLEDQFEGFFKSGNACNWRSLRDKVGTLTRLDQIVPEGSYGKRTPFMT